MTFGRVVLHRNMKNQVYGYDFTQPNHSYYVVKALRSFFVLSRITISPSLVIQLSKTRAQKYCNGNEKSCDTYENEQLHV